MRNAYVFCVKLFSRNCSNCYISCWRGIFFYRIYKIWHLLLRGPQNHAHLFCNLFCICMKLNIYQTKNLTYIGFFCRQLIIRYLNWIIGYNYPCTILLIKIYRNDLIGSWYIFRNSIIRLRLVAISIAFMLMFIEVA